MCDSIFRSDICSIGSLLRVDLVNISVMEDFCSIFNMEDVCRLFFMVS